VNSDSDEAGLIYLDLDDALEIYAAIFKLSPEQAADHLRSQEALQGALGRPESYAHDQRADVAL
jgi:hypothetical protein